MLHECLFQFQKSKNAQSPSVPLPVRSRDIRNRAAAGNPARLIDPVVYLTRDWLICQQVRSHFLTEPNSHFIGRSRDPIHSSAGKNTRTPHSRQYPFLKKFHFFIKCPFLLAEIAVFFRFSCPVFTPLPAAPRRPAPFSGADLRRFTPAVLAFYIGLRMLFSVSRRHFARAKKGKTWALS